MIESLSKLSKITKQLKVIRDGYFIWNGKRALDAHQFLTFMPVQMIACADYGDDVRHLERGGINIFSLEKYEGQRREWHHITEEIFQGEFGKQLKDNIRNLNREVNLICYHSSKYVEDFVDSNPSVNLLSVRIDLKESLDDKTVLPEALPKIGIKPITGEVSKMKQLTFEKLARKYGLPFVLQIPIGTAGSGTAFISRQAEFDSWYGKHENSKVKITRFVQGASVAINGVVYKDMVVYSQPNIQIVGQPECVTLNTNYCGSDFTITKTFKDSTFSKIYDYTGKIGRWLAAKGFKGMFGLDFIVTYDTEDVYVCEVNTRFTGENQFIADFQAIRNQVPLSFFHIASFLDINIPDEEIDKYNAALSPLVGSCITLHNREGVKVKVRGEMKPGIYTFEDGKLNYNRFGISLSDCRRDDEICITNAVPDKGMLIDIDASILRIQTFKSVLNEDKKTYNPWIKNIINSVYEKIL